MAPRILQETNISSKASKILLPKENLPKGTKDHEREWREMRRRWEKFGHSRVALRKYIEMRRGRCYPPL
jgi:hypothetical protein